MAKTIGPKYKVLSFSLYGKCQPISAFAREIYGTNVSNRIASRKRMFSPQELLQQLLGGFAVSRKLLAAISIDVDE